MNAGIVQQDIGPGAKAFLDPGQYVQIEKWQLQPVRKKEAPMDTNTNVQPEFGTPEWVAEFKSRTGMFPIAGAESDGGAPAAVAEADSDDAGQGESDSGLGLYDLDSVDPAYREDVAAHLKDIEGNVTRKFQEHSEYRDKMSPYEELGLDQYEPEEISNLLAFAQIANDPEAFQEWWEKVGEEYGFSGSDDDGDSDLDDDDDFSFDDDGPSDEDLANNLSQVVEDIVAEKLAPVEQMINAQQMAEMESQVEKQIEDTFEKLHDEHGEFDDDIVTRFALAYPGDPEAIQKGYADYEKFVGSTQQATVTSKVNGPSSTDGPGKADTNAKTPATIEAAGEALRERLNGAS